MTRTATYRVQLRGGMDFARLGSLLDQIADLGVSHLYLSPILTAAPGSTHGYDVTDPTEIDPALGGEAGFADLARAAHEHGLKLVLDIVPNHMAFTLETPWLRDVLRRGQHSPHAPVFDIDWEAGPVALPWLAAPLPELLDQGEVRVENTDLRVGDLPLPLAPGTAAGIDGPMTAEDLDRLHSRQNWRLLPWQLERDSITHRRFFSVTSLIGVRVEDAGVFEATHRAIFDLADRGLIDGLRIDHVDGLVDPAGYLERLAARLPDTPLWAEKILVTGESLPAWPIAGTTGYEAAAVIARALTDAEGLARIDALWRAETGIEGDFHDAVREAKYEVLTDELAAELRQLRGMAEDLAGEEGRPVGPEMLREALTELLVAFPRYRSYIGAAASAEDAALWRGSADRAAEAVRDRAVIDWIAERILAADSDAARRLGRRMEQVTGALIAKAHEDTAGFRFNRFLAANEVGADPDRPVAETGEVQAHLDARRADWPAALTAGSTHDTKRSEDTRARLIAASHLPDDLEALWRDAAALPGSDGIEPNSRFYALQAALGLWGEPEAADRLADHIVKALREGKEISYWTAPDEDREARAQDWLRGLVARWDAGRPEALLRIRALGETVALAETALRLAWPGMPDIYQGGEGALFQLTDPDNRRPPDWEALAALPSGDGFASRKAALVRVLLGLRRAHPDLFAHGEAEWRREGGERCLTRRLGGESVSIRIGPHPAPEAALWVSPAGPGPFGVCVAQG